jgi:hypothetical protein
MALLLVFLAIIVLFTLSLYAWNTFQQKKGATETADSRVCAAGNEGCCGKHEVCEKLELVKNLSSPKIEYFDDEELDAYAGTPSDQYTDKAVEQFREVLYSMYDSDKSGWLHSLRLRKIAVPDQLRDEIEAIMDKLQAAKQKKYGTV